MSEIRVRVPQVANIKEAIRIYYERTEIGSEDIRNIFGAIGSPRISKLKKLALERMREDGVPHYNATLVNTESAYEVWGIDIRRLEKSLERLAKLGIERSDPNAKQ